MTEGTQIYETELPPADDPDVVELAAEMVAQAKAAQRPIHALAVGALGLPMGVLIWGELNRLAGFEMPWLVMGGSAAVLGALLGYPYRKVGRLFDLYWAVLAAGLGLLMGVLGDLHAIASIGSEQSGVSWADYLAHLDFAVWWEARLPIDWLVAGLGAMGAFAAARPPLDGRQLVMEARIAIHVEDLAEEAEGEAEADLLAETETVG